MTLVLVTNTDFPSLWRDFLSLPVLALGQEVQGNLPNGKKKKRDRGLYPSLLFVKKKSNVFPSVLLSGAEQEARSVRKATADMVPSSQASAFLQFFIITGSL